MRFDMLNFTLIGQTRHPLGQENWKIEIIESFLADGTNGRAVGTLLRPSVCLSVCRRRRRLCRYVLWLNGAS